MMGTIYRHGMAMTEICGRYTGLLLTLVHGRPLLEIRMEDEVSK
jgi:hypothetical protein